MRLIVDALTLYAEHFLGDRFLTLIIDRHQPSAGNLPSWTKFRFPL
jgi:hypothetical protein